MEESDCEQVCCRSLRVSVWCGVCIKESRISPIEIKLMTARMFEEVYETDEAVHILFAVYSWAQQQRCSWVQQQRCSRNP